MRIIRRVKAIFSAAARRRAGFTLIELLASMLILVFMVVGMGSGLAAASRIYKESVFESDSAMLASMVDTSVGDLLRYSQQIQASPAGGFQDSQGTPLADVSFVFTSPDYGVTDAYFYVSGAQDARPGLLQMKTLHSTAPHDLLNQGAYPNLGIRDFVASYDSTAQLFTVSYTVYSLKDETRTRSETCTIRLLNPPA